MLHKLFDINAQYPYNIFERLSNNLSNILNERMIFMMGYNNLKRMREHPEKSTYEDFLKLYQQSNKFPETLLALPGGVDVPKWLDREKIKGKRIKIKSRVVGTVSAFNPDRSVDEGEREIYLCLAIVVAKVNKEIFNDKLSTESRNCEFPDDDKLHYAIFDFGMFVDNGYKFTSFNRDPKKMFIDALKESPFKKLDAKLN